MKVIQIPLKNDETRPAFEDIPHGMQVFFKGQRVLSAYDYENQNATSIYFVKEHAVGEKNWPEGGYQCVDIGGGFRAFYLDALIIHPSQIKTSQALLGKSKRGRPKMMKIQLENGIEVEPKPPGKRGRPKLYDNPEDRPSYIKPKEEGEKRKRGRPADPNRVPKEKKEYVSSGAKRGRPKLYENAEDRPSYQKQQEKAKNVGNKSRGRPRKNLS